MTSRSLPPSGFQIASTALLLSLLGGVHSQSHGDSLNIDTPNALGECDTTKFTWEGGQAPFTLNVHFQKNNSIFQGFDNLNGTALSWQAALPAGNVLYLELLDASHTSRPAFSASFTIQPGNDACLQSSTASSSTGTAVATTSGYTGTGGFSSTSPSVTSSTARPSDPDPSSKISTHALSPGAIAGIAVASLVAGLLIALAVWLVRRRRKPSSTGPRIPAQQQLDTYRYPESRRSDDGWSVTTPRDPDDSLRSQPDGDKTGLSWDPSLFAREKTPSPSPSPPTDHPVVPRQDVHPGTRIAGARPLSSYPPLIPIPIPTPTPIPMPARESGPGMWVDSESGSGASLSRSSSTNPFRARMLAAAASSETGTAQIQAGVNGSSW